MTDHGVAADEHTADCLTALAKAAGTDSDLDRMQQLSRANTLALLAVSERLADAHTAVTLCNYPDLRVDNDRTISDTPFPRPRGPHDHGTRH